MILLLYCALSGWLFLEIVILIKLMIDLIVLKIKKTKKYKLMWHKYKKVYI